eukprot:TRINITY_DN35646_c0_g1_i2.p2 TRINITY_DN35646_c0_g1~~TRINITY_DN35646_c0_g1_i2.p2  ORF type:complete len:169 (+),score=18.45 TRINITY_DN35646_c0_g1_i2:602-1108(+)
MPYTSSRKIHRKILELLNISQEDTINFDKPQTEIEKSLVEIWSDVLNIPKDNIGIKSDFFSIGGHSLKAISMVSRIQTFFNVEITLKEMFNHSTIHELASIIENLKMNKSEEPFEEHEYDRIRIQIYKNSNYLEPIQVLISHFQMITFMAVNSNSIYNTKTMGPCTLR